MKRGVTREEFEKAVGEFLEGLLKDREPIEPVVTDETTPEDRERGVIRIRGTIPGSKALWSPEPGDRYVPGDDSNWKTIEERHPDGRNVDSDKVLAAFVQASVEQGLSLLRRDSWIVAASKRQLARLLSVLKARAVDCKPERAVELQESPEETPVGG